MPRVRLLSDCGFSGMDSVVGKIVCARIKHGRAVVTGQELVNSGAKQSAFISKSALPTFEWWFSEYELVGEGE